MANSPQNWDRYSKLHWSDSCGHFDFRSGRFTDVLGRAPTTRPSTLIELSALQAGKNMIPKGTHIRFYCCTNRRSNTSLERSRAANSTLLEVIEKIRANELRLRPWDSIPIEAIVIYLLSISSLCTTPILRVREENLRRGTIASRGSSLPTFARR